MRALPRLLLCGLLLSPVLGRATEPAGSCEALKAENEALKARLRALEAQLPTTASTAAPSAARAPVEARPAPVPAVAAPVPPAAALPGLAPKPAPKRVVVEEEPYSRSGCRAGLFTPLPHARWMEKDRWLDLEKGMSPVEVEQLLGPEHYDSVGGSRVKWEYGKCEAASKAQLLFDQGQLLDWRPPTQ